jgi:hypothetical protein
MGVMFVKYFDVCDRIVAFVPGARRVLAAHFLLRHYFVLTVAVSSTSE